MSLNSSTTASMRCLNRGPVGALILQAPAGAIEMASRLAGDGAQRLLGKAQVDALHLEQPLVMLDQRILRFNQNALERGLVEIFEGGEHWQAPDEFRDQAALQ
jgi:hypothetical protein